MQDSKKPIGKHHRPNIPQWGKKLGSFCNIPAYSNSGTYIENHFLQPEETGQKEVIYAGIKYQCVEYARRFMAMTQQTTFDEIDFAWQIFELSHVKDLMSDSLLPFHSFENNSSVPPKPGDLIIHQKSKNQRHGHVSVVVKVNLNKKYVCVIEQNYEHRFWNNRHYSRKLVLKVEDDKFYLYNKRVGRKYPKVLQHSDSEDSDEEGIIGWKRVDRPLKVFEKVSIKKSKL